ncbi:gamma-glutamyltransferase [Streptosporangiaceae bacterium NEAU-GS5]|nr:gamma-glutamyltransferase [Streptosporangiaceae bacterium NEAU-GS5]
MMTCAVAAPHTLATDAAEEALRRGGNAIDAALAAAVTLTVVYPHNTAAGGDLIALVRTAGGRISCLNASGPAARAADRDAVAARHGGRMPIRGVDAITVPGCVAGWAALHASGAALPWAAHFAAAIAHAAGTPVVPGLAAAIAEAAPLIDADPGMRAVFRPGGRLLAEGDVLRQDALAATLSGIADGGPEVLYGGPVGERLIAGLRVLGSPLDRTDLDAYRAEWTPPLSRPVGAWQVHTSPPNSQGFLLLQALLADVADPLRTGAGRLAQVFAQGIADRARVLADPRFAPVDLDALLRPGRALPGEDVAAYANGDTVAVVTADGDGNAVSLIQSLFFGFGSGVLEPDTGILMQNRGAGFTLDPGSPNVLAPGKRPAHTLMPVMVTEGDRLAWVTGSMGGRAQPQIHTQILLRLFGGADPTAAVAAPRWVVGEPDLAVRVEADVDPAARDSLAELAGLPLTELPARSDRVGHAQAIAIGLDGAPTAGSDPRADGAARVVKAVL